ncbi:MAG: TonB-dependent receptor [Caulobacter sp.]
MASRKLLGALLLSSGIVAPCLAAAQEAGQTVETTVEEVVVTGQRASDRDSLAKKRDAISAVEVVSANDVGKLPDQNVAEAVRRLSGVSVATDKGEGRYLIIRGIEPNLANVTINNQTASAPEPESRNVKLDDIPSALIGSVTVIKSLTPDLDANAIAGQVDINTLSAFDRNKTILSARVVRGTFEATDAKATEGDVSVGGKFGPERQFGLVLAGNYSERPSVSEDVLTSARQVINGIDLPTELDIRSYSPAVRKRTGAVANFDWRPNDDVKLYARLMYSKFDDNETRDRFRFFLPTSASGYSSLSADGGTISSTTARHLVRRRNEITNTTTLAFGGDFNLGDGVLTVQGTHALAEKKDPIRDEFDYRSTGTLTGVFVGTSGLPSSLSVSAAALDPSTYNLRQYKQVSRKAEENLDQLRVDYKLPISAWGEGSYLKFGAKYLDRDKTSDANGHVYTRSNGETLVGETSKTLTSVYNGRFAFGPSVDYKLAKAYFEANKSLFTDSASDRLIETLGSDFKVVEKITAAYGMVSVTHGDLTVIPGVRVERTEGETAAIAVTPSATVNDTYNQFGGYAYTDWFPSVNLRYNISPRLMVRGAVTTALGRPNYADLAPTLSVSSADNEVTLGNPDLQPQKALNFDASLEYYFPREGGVSVGFFHKRIENPIFSSTATESGTWGGVSLTNADVTQMTNGDKARVTGLEFNVQKPLTFLPSPFDGLGVNFNATLVDGKMDVPGRSEKVQLPNQSKRLASAQLYYEKYSFSARLAYTYRSAYLYELNTGDASGASDIYFGKATTLSARVGYRFNKVEFFAEGNNLTDATDYYYYQTRSRFAESETYGRSYRFGLSYTF